MVLKSILNGPFVSEEGAKKLHEYHYQGEDRSLVAKYYYPFWKKLVVLFPLRTSPNCISLLGTAFPIAAFLYAYILGTPPPSHVFLLYAFCLFVYQTMDALDGLQGRRVDMYYNPTTEIFDHGCDSVIMSITSIMACIGMGIIGSKLSILFVMSALCTFFWPTWEHLNTGVMIFRGGVLNPTEGLIMSQLMFLVTGLFPTVWIKTLNDMFGISASINLPFLAPLLGTSNFELGDLAVNQIIVLVSFFSTVMAGMSSISNVITAHRMKNVREPTKPTQASLLTAFSGLLPLISVCTAAYLWSTHMSTCSCNQIWRCQPLALMAVTIPWNYAIYNIIISEITVTKIKVMRILIGQLPMFLPLLPIPLVSNWGEHYLLGISLAVSLYVYLMTVRNALGEVCAALGMKHFWSIPMFDNPPHPAKVHESHPVEDHTRSKLPGKAD